ncbi:U11/U12 small nuclear ribonucleoprotein 25 kDa protein isoform X1 [Hylobates moloch]|uniref:U11/U12 small nuclear ribonucleoprotein 25 kDa protein isoform X1 n=1 Tax=Hylobates moloch TaxID=81572 RepID=UPI0013621553|nr:U11/U12 small nuclear ribonucleoprotein 25 kDa protein isoform X1 [Hylobates moloch]
MWSRLSQQEDVTVLVSLLRNSQAMPRGTGATTNLPCAQSSGFLSCHRRLWLWVLTMDLLPSVSVVAAVVVVQSATVLDLKKAIQRYVQLKQEREGGIQHISWSYVWRTYHLTSAGEKLTEDRKKLRDYGIRNRDEVSFIKKLRQK